MKCMESETHLGGRSLGSIAGAGALAVSLALAVVLAFGGTQASASVQNCGSIPATGVASGENIRAENVPCEEAREAVLGTTTSPAIYQTLFAPESAEERRATVAGFDCRGGERRLVTDAETGAVYAYQPMCEMAGGKWIRWNAVVFVAEDTSPERVAYETCIGPTEEALVQAVDAADGARVRVGRIRQLVQRARGAAIRAQRSVQVLRQAQRAGEPREVKQALNQARRARQQAQRVMGQARTAMRRGAQIRRHARDVFQELREAESAAEAARRRCAAEHL